MKHYCFKKVTLLLILQLFIAQAFAQNWDIDLLKPINPPNPNSDYWKITSRSAYWVPATGIAASFVVGSIQKNKQLRAQSYKALVSITVGTIATEIVKISVNRTRPSYTYPNDVSEGEMQGQMGRSLPSGHTSLAFTYATTLALENKKWYVTVSAYLWAGSVGYSRMYLGKHYPSDVLVGAALGTLSGWLTYKLNKKLFKSK